ncbi:hypothetical protein AB1Y20_013181 [Prymnesium parvum]|uniref:Uncharacterized protein n=1 Tax=Prymnesium parvum TaxID=97485 RepID=A0AB34IMP0_PRYPA
MGCCCSGEANAPETQLPPPAWGQPIKVYIKKQGMFRSDYNVLNESAEGEKWMLIDAVGGMFDDGYNYFLKHRASGQVDADGKAQSTVLGAVNIKGEHDAFSFKVSGGRKDVDLAPFYDIWDHDIDWGMTFDKVLWAVWTYSKRAILYSDYEMTTQIGWLDITGSGTWYEREEIRIVHDTDANGNTQVRHEKHRVTNCKTQGFRYKFNVFNTPMVITYQKEPGKRFWSNPTLTYTAANAFAPDIPLFVTSGDGENFCTVETFVNSDPVSTILAAYAIVCKLDPREFGSHAGKKCEKHIHLGMPPGFSNFVGMDERTFEQRFTYSAPVPAAFASQVASFVPQGQPMVPFGIATSDVQLDMGYTQNAPAGQPMGQPVAVAQPVGLPFGQPMGAHPPAQEQQPLC